MRATDAPFSAIEASTWPSTHCMLAQVRGSSFLPSPSAGPRGVAKPSQQPLRLQTAALHGHLRTSICRLNRMARLYERWTRPPQAGRLTGASARPRQVAVPAQLPIGPYRLPAASPVVAVCHPGRVAERAPASRAPEYRGGGATLPLTGWVEWWPALWASC